MASAAPSRLRTVYTRPDTLIPRLESVGWSMNYQARQPGLIEHAHRGCYEICLIRWGEVDWRVGEQIYTVRGGEVFFTFPDEIHGGLDNAMHPCELIWVIVDLTHDPNLPALPGMDEATWMKLIGSFEQLQRRHFRASQPLIQAFQGLHQAHGRDDAWCQAEAGAVLCQLLVGVLRDHDRHQGEEALPSTPHAASSHSPGRESTSDRTPETDHPEAAVAVSTSKGVDHEDDLVARAAAIIASRVEDHLPMQELAQELGVSAATLRTHFAARYGMTPAQYLRRRKIDRACELLRTTEMSTTRIAYRLGFSSSQHMATAFRRLRGRSPTAYRQAAGDAST